MNFDHLSIVGIRCVRKKWMPPLITRPEIGEVCGLWTVIGPIVIENKSTKRMCRCECGTERLLETAQLRRGRTKSCGCRVPELSRAKATKHGRARSSEYNSWRAMKDRCSNPHNEKYEFYGGRGITYCERWNDFNNFLEDMGDKPTPQHTIDRIDVEGNYEPGNCRWATWSEQAVNKRPKKKPWELF